MSFFVDLDKPYYLKKYCYPSLAKRCKNLLLGARPYRVWRHVTEFAEALPTPSPLMLFTLRGGAEICYITEFVSDAQNLHALFKAGAIDDVQAVLKELAQMIAQMHQQGWLHGDLKWTNFVRDNDGKIFIIDLDGLAKQCRWFADDSYKDLARFVLNAEDLSIDKNDFAVFVETYCELRGIAPEQLKPKVLPQLKKLRARHLIKYGPRGAAIF